MPRFNRSQTSFLAGEISPRAHGRTDLPQYQAGLDTLKNFIIHKQGGASRRPGNQFIVETQNNLKARLIPFIFSQDVFFIIEITAQASGIIIRDPSDPMFDFVQPIGGSAGLANFPGQFTNYTEAQLDEIHDAQVGNRLYLSHPDQPPIFLERIIAADGTISWRIADWFSPSNTTITAALEHQGFPFQTRNAIPTLTITSSATAIGTTTITASSSLFNANHIGSIWKHEITATIGYFRITGFASDVSVTAEILTTLGGTGTTDLWNEGAWSVFRGYPRALTFLDQRLVFGGTASFPDRIWGSGVGALHLFEVPTSPSESDPFDHSIGSSSQVNLIEWLSVGKEFQIGTSANEYIVTGSDPAAIISSANAPVFKPDSSTGSTHVQPVRFESNLAFISQDGLRVHELGFNFNESAFVSRDLSSLGEHMAKKSQNEVTAFNVPQITNMQYQIDNNIIWVIDNNGGLFAVTRDKANQITAWHFHRIGGSDGADIAKVLSIIVVPAQNGGSHDLWMVVRRTIESETRFYIERMNNEFLLDALNNTSLLIENKPVYSDSAHFRRLSTATVNWSGFDHIIGETVDVVGDGAYLGTKVIVAGANLITNPGAETNTAGWNLYKDAASQNPVDGTGGSPNATLVRNTSSPITGTGDFDLSNATGDRLGEGVSTDFVLTSGLDGQDLQIEFEYDSSDPAIGVGFTGSSIRVFLFNIDSAKLEQMNLHSLLTSTGFFKARFQTTIGDTNYRLIIHIATATTTNFNFFFDNVKARSVGFTLTTAVKEVIAGLTYQSLLKTLRLEAGSALGSAQGARKKLDRSFLRFNRTVGAKFGRVDTALDDVVFRKPSDPMDTAVPLFTGDKRIDFQMNFDTDAQVIVTQDIALPCEVVALITRGITND